MRHGFILVLGTLIALLCYASAFAREDLNVGQFVLSATGSAQNSIPIWAPSGPQCIRPNRVLVYGSNSDIDPLGIGSQVAGLGAAGCTLDIKPALFSRTHRLFGRIG